MKYEIAHEPLAVEHIYKFTDFFNNNIAAL